MERVIAFSIEHVLVQNVLQFHRHFGVPFAFHLRSICVPFAFHFMFHLRSSSLFSYFCPVLYPPILTSSSVNNCFKTIPTICCLILHVTILLSGSFSTPTAIHLSSYIFLCSFQFLQHTCTCIYCLRHSNPKMSLKDSHTQHCFCTSLLHTQFMSQPHNI